MLRIRHKVIGLLFLAAAQILQGCSSNKQPDTSVAPDSQQPAAASPAPVAADPQSPASYKALFTTSNGNFTVEVNRDWAPLGADRFHALVKSGFFDGARFFRVLRGDHPFMAQFGINGDPKVTAKWEEAIIKDDLVKERNVRGMLSFATAGPDTRTTQVFINYGDNSRLDKDGFSPFGRVIAGMEIVDKLYAEYGEGSPNGAGPDQTRIETEGNAYLEKEFPRLDYIKSARIVE